MWSEQNEKEFQALIKKYKEDPRQTLSDEDLGLIKQLTECYLAAEPMPGGEIPFFKKISSLYNVFLESYLKEHPDVFKDKQSFDKVLKEFPPGKIYPFYAVLGKFIGNEHKKENERATAAYKNFVKPPIEGFLSNEESQYLNPYFSYGTPYANPKPDPKDVSTLSYNEMAQKIYSNAELKQKGELKLGKERDELVHAFYRNHRVNALNDLNQIYRTLNVVDLKDIPHIFYRDDRFARLYPEYNGSFIQDILPHPVFAKVAKLAYQDKMLRENIGNNRPMTELLGKIFTEENQAFSGYKVLSKTAGKESGFVLVSPDGKKRYYAKYTDDIIPEYFCSKTLSHLGIKMPEAQLLTDEYGNRFFATLDVSKKYQKGEQVKTKAFMSIEEELRGARQEAFGLEEREGDLPKEKQEKMVQKFLAEGTSSKESRKSFAKLLLVGAAFGLTDFGGHGGNVGLIRAEKSEKQYAKFGIIDYSFHPTEITEELNGDLLKYLKERTLYKVMPIFNKIFETLTTEDFMAAAEDLANPKGRMYTKEGLLLTSSPTTRTTGEKIIEDTFKEVAKELQSTLPLTEYKAQMEKLGPQKDIMVKNLEALISAARKIDLKANVETKQKLDKPKS